MLLCPRHIVLQLHVVPTNIYCGVFTPRRSCNLETRPRDYATVDEEVFSPCRAESRSAVPWRVASPRLLPDNSYKTWMTQDWEMVTWPRQQWRHAFQQWRNNWSTVGRRVSRVSDQGSSFTSSSRWEIAVVLGRRRRAVVSSERVSCNSTSVKSRFYMECVIKWDCYNSCVLRSVTRRQLVETENLSACATVNLKVCKWAIALYFCIWV
jgi:hypothetical protein